MKKFTFNSNHQALLASLAIVATLAACSEDSKGTRTTSSAQAKDAIKKALQSEGKSNNAKQAVLPAKAADASKPEAAIYPTEVWEENTSKFVSVVGSMEPSSDVQAVNASFIGFYSDENGSKYLRTWHHCDGVSQDGKTPRWVLVMTSMPLDVDADAGMFAINTSGASTQVVLSSSDEDALAATCASIGNSFINRTNIYIYNSVDSQLTLTPGIVDDDAYTLTYSKVSFE